MTDVAMTLTEFLLARISEDEAVWGGVQNPAPRTDLMLTAGEWPDGESAVLLSINRHAAECAAKRRIVERCSDPTGFPEFGPLGDVLAFLALPYADHAEYRDEWSPDA